MSTTLLCDDTAVTMFVSNFLIQMKSEADLYFTPGPLHKEMLDYAAALVLTYDAPLPAVSDNTREYVLDRFVYELIRNGSVPEYHLNGQRQEGFLPVFVQKRIFVLKNKRNHALYVDQSSNEYKAFCMMLCKEDGRYIDPSLCESIELRKELPDYHPLRITSNSSLTLEEFERLDEENLVPESKTELPQPIQMKRKRKRRRKTNQRQLIAA